MTDAADIENALRLILTAPEEARRVAVARLGGDAVEGAKVDDVWPPDPMTINLHDGTWLLIRDAMHEARCSEITIRRRIAFENIAVQIGGVWWVNRARLLSGRRYPKSPDQI